MSRQIISKNEYLQIKNANIKPSVKQDSYLERLFKYIPSEIVLLYITCEKIILSQAKISIGLYWFISTFCFIITPLYLLTVMKVKKLSQLIISTLSFAVWIFALGGPFNFLSWYKPFYGALTLPIFTFLISFVQ